MDKIKIILDKIKAFLKSVLLYRIILITLVSFVLVCDVVLFFVSITLGLLFIIAMIALFEIVFRCGEANGKRKLREYVSGNTK